MVFYLAVCDRKALKYKVRPPVIAIKWIICFVSSVVIFQLELIFIETPRNKKEHKKALLKWMKSFYSSFVVSAFYSVIYYYPM